MYEPEALDTNRGASSTRVRNKDGGHFRPDSLRIMVFAITLTEEEYLTSVIR